MTTGRRGGSFWTSLAGVLTALGGVIAAAAALIGALAAIGVIDLKREPGEQKPTGPQGNLDVSTSRQPFGRVQVGHASAMFTITITNRGEAPTTVTSSLEGTHADDFIIALDTCRESIVARDKSCHVYLEFSPREMGSRTAALRISADHALAPPPVALTGEALRQGSVLFDPPSGTVSLATLTGQPPTKGSGKVKVTNKGPGTLTIKAVKVNDPKKHFTVTSDCLNRTLKAGEFCTLTVELKVSTSETGSFTAEALLEDDAADSPQTLPLSGFRGNFKIDPRIIVRG